MISQSIQKTIVILVAVLLVVYIGYGLVTSTPDASAVDPNADTSSQDILSLVDRLSKISIDQSVFSSPTFTSLVDFSVGIINEDKGRPNPFAPIGVENSSNTVVGTNKVVKK